jgi:AcrR family transcriptional regulator
MDYVNGRSMPKSRKVQNLEATRAALMAVARKHFARDGYSDAEIAAIAADARVTTGAVYHHFASKKGLFTAVAEDLEAEILRTAASVTDDDPWRRLRGGFEKLIDLCAAPAVQRIVFVEAPQVVGPEAWRKIELQYAFGTLRNVLVSLREAGIIKPYPVDLIARTLLALLHETSAELARSKHDPAVRTQISEMVAGVFDVFLAGHPARVIGSGRTGGRRLL